MSVEKPPVVVILGPTAVGKSDIAIRLAQRLEGEIVSADSRLFYRGMDIGTAKPTDEERKRIPHYLIDVAEPNDVWNLAKFKTAARQAIAGIHGRDKLPMLVGGTGQYIQAVVQDWIIPRVEPNPQLRQILERWAGEIGVDGLHYRLSKIDPIAGERIDYRNLRRTVRALEVIFCSGRLFSEQGRSAPAPYELLKIGLIRPRAELYERIDNRIVSMIDAGLVDEVKRLLDEGYSRDSPAFSAIGYREIVSYLLGELTLEEAVALIKRQTRVFVRRQANWFKLNDPTIQWFEMQTASIDMIESYIRLWLK